MRVLAIAGSGCRIARNLIPPRGAADGGNDSKPFYTKESGCSCSLGRGGEGRAPLAPAGLVLLVVGLVLARRRG